MKFKAFITNLGKYNEGELIGEWIELPVSEDELEEVYKRIGINEEYEEIFFTDYDSPVNLDLGEYESIEHLNELAEHFEDFEDELAEAIIEAYGVQELMDTSENDWILYEDINNEYDLGYYYAEQSGCYDLGDGILSRYFDYEAFGRDITFDGNGEFTSNGWLERC